jgi:hypothetical protein
MRRTIHASSKVIAPSEYFLLSHAALNFGQAMSEPLSSLAAAASIAACEAGLRRQPTAQQGRSRLHQDVLQFAVRVGEGGGVVSKGADSVHQLGHNPMQFCGRTA